MIDKNYRDNTIVNDDCLVYLKDQVEDDIFDLVIADPPYYTMNNPNITFKKRKDMVRDSKFDLFPSLKDYLGFTQQWIELVSQKAKKDASIYIFCAIQYVSYFIAYLKKFDWEYKGIITWIKTNPAPKVRKKGYVSATEHILFMTRGNFVFNFTKEEKMNNYITTSICMRPERLLDKTNLNKKGKPTTLHPTEKPEDIITPLVLNSSNPDQLILDPFAGTGKTNYVAKKWGRYSLGIELNPKYAIAGQERLSKITPMQYKSSNLGFMIKPKT